MNKIKYINKIIFYILKLSEYKIPIMKIDQIVTDNIKCLTEEELYIKKLANTLYYVMNNYHQVFNKELLNQLYYLLTNSFLDEQIINNIIEKYYENIDNSVYYLIAVIHMFIINNVKKNKIEFAFIISEFIILNKNNTLLIPRDFVHLEYNKAIENNNFALFVKLIFDMEYIINDKYPCKYTKEEIIQKIKEVKNKLIKEFDVKKLFLFGSFAKDTNNESSDVDFLVILDDNLINVERLKQVDYIKEFLSKELECRVDVLDFSYALENLGENEMENIVTLI